MEGKCIRGTMSKIKTILLCTEIILLSWLMANGCEARWIQYDGDLEAATSDKYEWKKSNERDHHQSDFAKHGKKGKKGYESKHGQVEGNSGHHDKEKHKEDYDEKKGHKKKHHDDSGYHHTKIEGKQKENGHKYNEEGRFRKGHSIHGQHIVHKLDESEKKNTFFDEDFDEEYDEGYGRLNSKHESKKANSHKNDHKHLHFDNGEAKKKGHGKKGHHHQGESGHRSEMGNEKNWTNKSRHSKTGNNEHSKHRGQRKSH